MQQFRQEPQPDEIRLSEDEARVLAALHARRREIQNQPSLSELATQLGLSEAEAMAMLTEVRAQSKPASPPVAQTPPVHRDHRGLSSSSWALVSLAAAVIVLVSGLFAFRAYQAKNDAPPALVETSAPASSGVSVNIGPEGVHISAPNGQSTGSKVEEVAVPADVAPEQSGTAAQAVSGG